MQNKLYNDAKLNVKHQYDINIPSNIITRSNISCVILGCKRLQQYDELREFEEEDGHCCVSQNHYKDKECFLMSNVALNVFHYDFVLDKNAY